MQEVAEKWVGHHDDESAATAARSTWAYPPDGNRSGHNPHFDVQHTRPKRRRRGHGSASAAVYESEPVA